MQSERSERGYTRTKHVTLFVSPSSTPHHPDHTGRTEPSELHRQHEMDHPVRTLFVSDGHMTRREIRKFGILQIAPGDPLNCKVPIMQSERRLKWLFLIWETTTHKVDPLIHAKLFNDPRCAGYLSIYPRECGETIDELMNIVQCPRKGVRSRQRLWLDLWR